MGILDPHRRALANQIFSVHLLIAPGMRVRHQDGRQAKEGELSQDRGAGAREHQIGGGQRRSHLLMQIRKRVVATAQGLRQGAFAGFDVWPVEATADVHHLRLGEQRFQVGQQSLIDRARALAPSEDQQHRRIGLQVQPGTRCGAIPLTQSAAHRIARDVHRLSGGEVATGILDRNGNAGGHASQHLQSQPRLNIRHGEQHRATTRRQPHRYCHIAAGEEEHIGLEFAHHAPRRPIAAQELPEIGRQASPANAMYPGRRNGTIGKAGARHQLLLHAPLTTHPQHLQRRRREQFLQGLKHGERGIHAAAGSPGADQ